MPPEPPRPPIAAPAHVLPKLGSASIANGSAGAAVSMSAAANAGGSVDSGVGMNGSASARSLPTSARVMRLTLRHTVGTRMHWPASQYTRPRSCVCGAQAARVTERHRRFPELNWMRRNV